MCLTWVNLARSPPGAARPCLNTPLLFLQAWLLAIYCKPLKWFSQKTGFEILRTQKNAWSMHLLPIAFWHQCWKFKWAHWEGAWASLSRPFCGKGDLWSDTASSMDHTNTAGQTSAKLLLPNDPTNKSHQSNENSCFRGCLEYVRALFFPCLAQKWVLLRVDLGIMFTRLLPGVHTQL